MTTTATVIHTQTAHKTTIEITARPMRPGSTVTLYDVTEYPTAAPQHRSSINNTDDLDAAHRIADKAAAAIIHRAAVDTEWANREAAEWARNARDAAAIWDEA
ncbi:MAG TPA: hypothetical protein VIO38_08950 [Rariglobus sp.]